MRIIKIAGILLFCAMLAGGMLSTAVVPSKEVSQTENRTLETKPELSAADVLSGEYQEHYEVYLNDQMIFRDSWVSLAAAMERMLGRRDINGVYIGKDGYLLEKYNKSDFDAVQAEENIDILCRFLNDAADRYGRENVTCMLLPSKADALPQKLPGFADGNGEEGTAAALKNGLKDPDMLMDIGSVLRGHQEEYIYYRTDHHWTTLGAYYAYQAFAERMGFGPKPLTAYDRETVFDDFYGTTYNKVHIRVPADAVELFHSPAQDGVSVNIDDGELVSDSFYFKEEASEGFNRYNVFFSKNTAKIEVTTKAQTGRALLFVKDSFANCFVPFLAQDYEQVIMFDCRYGKDSIRDFMAEHDEITDVLVMYNVEKFMQDTNLGCLDKQSDTGGTMEEFDLDDFLSDTDA